MNECTNILTIRFNALKSHVNILMHDDASLENTQCSAIVEYFFWL